MGDFDRFEKPAQANESKKLVTVAALGALLLGLVGYQLVKRGPQQAAAAEISGQPEAASASETPAALRDALTNNPTATLLQKDGLQAPPPKPLRNPFRMSSAWLAALNPPVQATRVPTTTAATRPVVPQIVVNAVVPITLRAEDFKLSSVVTTGSGMAAIINGKVVRAGDVVGQARILEITGEEVTLQHVSFPDGPITTISMQRKLN
jgi:hypothetical protein